MKRSALVLPAVLCSFVAAPVVATSQVAPVTAPTQAKAPAAANGQSPATPATGATETGTSSLTPRGPEAIAQQDPNRVVATIGGKPVTAKQALELLKAIQPEDRKRYEGKLADLVRQIYMEDATADEAVKLKLDQQSPWKEQLQISRANILTQAYLTHEAAASTPVDPKAYYDAHPADSDQVKLSGILVTFNPPGTPANASGVQRTEADALAKANDIEKKIKAGGDFSALARTDSDNQQTAARGGEIGTFTLDSPNVPQNVKDLISKMQPGQVAEPFRIPGGFYIFKVDDRTKLGFEQVKAAITQKQQAERTQALLKQQMDRYDLKNPDAEFFGASAAPTSKIPSLQKPAVAPAPPTSR